MHNPKANILGAAQLIHLLMLVPFGLTSIQPVIFVHPPVTAHPQKHFKQVILSLQV